MSPAHVLEPTYRAIKQRLMAGEWPPGYHLDTARLADDLGVSKSPVRDSLNHLAGERMVEFEAGVGFHVPRLTETQLQDLLDLNLGLLMLALRSETRIRPIPTVYDAADGASRRFLGLARASGNTEIIAAVGGINDRLSAVRRLDALVFSEPDVTLEELDSAIGARADLSAIAEILIRYHRERKQNGSKLIRLLAVGVDPE